MRWLLKYRIIWLTTLGILTLVMGIGLWFLRINFSFESFYPKDDSEFIYYERFLENFTEEQTYVNYIALKSPGDDIFDQVFLQKADSIFKEIRTYVGIDSLISSTEMVQVRRRGLSIEERPYIEFASIEEVDRSRKRLAKDTSLVGTFITKDMRHICAYAFIDPEIFDSPARDDLNREIEAILSKSGLDHVVSGIPFVRTKYVETIAGELLLFLSMSLVLITAVLFLTYRSFWGVLLPQIAVIASLIWILGFMGLTGQDINLISNLLIPIMFVVGTSDVIHLMTKYLNEVRQGKPREIAIRITLKEIGIALFFTSVTTAVGFASLLVSKIPPIRDFGLYAACGVLFTFILTIVILPNLLMLIEPKHFFRTKSVESSPFWTKSLDRVFKWTQERSLLIGILSVLVIGSSTALIFRIPTDTHLVEDIGKNDPIRKAMEFFEEESYGMRPFEIGIHVRSDSLDILDQRILTELDKMEKWLRKEENFSPFLSPASLVREANYIYHNSRSRFRKVPDSQADVDDIVGFMAVNPQSSTLLEKVIDKEGKMGRLSATCSDLGTERFDEIYLGLEDYVNANCDTSLFTYRPTGHAFLTERNLIYVRRSLLGGLSIAFVIVGFLMGVLFKSVRMLLISMVPNVIPLILTGGVMGLFGITLTASTALVFVIAFGIAVDDTIHFLTRYRLEIQKGRNKSQAIYQTLQGTGKAMILTSLILMGGFVLLLASDFGGTLNTGLFTALTIVFALFADLLLLPILLKYFG